MIVIGLTGTLGAGKGTVVEYLKEEGFEHFSVRAFLIEEISRRGLLPTRETMHIVANDLRTKNRPSYLIDTLYDRALKNPKNSVIESIHTTGEVESLRHKGDFHLVAVDADKRLRYERIKKRGSETDHVSFEQFEEIENVESKSDDPGTQNLLGCIKLADFVIENNGTIEEVRARIDEILAKIIK